MTQRDKITDAESEKDEEEAYYDGVWHFPPRRTEKEAAATDPRPDPRTHPEYWTE